MGCAASSPLARALNPARFINQAKEASAAKDVASDETPYPLHGIAEGVKGRVGAAVDGFEEKIGSTIHTVSDQVSHVAHEMEAKFGGAVQSVGDAVGSAIHGAEEAVSGGASKAHEMLSHAQDAVHDSVKEVLPQRDEAEMQELLDSIDEATDADPPMKSSDAKPDPPPEEKMGDVMDPEENADDAKDKAEPEIATIHM